MIRRRGFKISDFHVNSARLEEQRLDEPETDAEDSEEHELKRYVGSISAIAPVLNAQSEDDSTITYKKSKEGKLRLHNHLGDEILSSGFQENYRRRQLAAMDDSCRQSTEDISINESERHKSKHKDLPVPSGGREGFNEAKSDIWHTRMCLEMQEEFLSSVSYLGLIGSAFFPRHEMLINHTESDTLSPRSRVEAQLKPTTTNRRAP